MSEPWRNYSPRGVRPTAAAQIDLAASLWSANEDVAEACRQTAFVRGVADGSLPRERFRAYVAQDASFLEAFARAYALALAHSPDRRGLEAFHALVGGVLDELHLHAAYAADWEVDMATVKPSAATLAYTDFMLSVASLRSVGETCAAMTPCMRLYAYLGQQLAPGSPPGNPYQDWIKTYAAAEFESLAQTLESLLNRYASDGDSIRATYRRAMHLELAFFEAHSP